MDLIYRRPESSAIASLVSALRTALVLGRRQTMVTNVTSVKTETIRRLVVATGRVEE